MAAWRTAPLPHVAKGDLDQTLTLTHGMAACYSRQPTPMVGNKSCPEAEVQTSQGCHEELNEHQPQRVKDMGYLSTFIANTLQKPFGGARVDTNVPSSAHPGRPESQSWEWRRLGHGPRNVE